jgi:hypothetical protein
MKLFLDRKKREFVKSTTSNVALEHLVLKRRDLVPLEFIFVENGAAVTLPTGTEIKCALKLAFNDANFLALATGASPTLDLNTVPLEAAFSTGAAALQALIEVRWLVPGETLRTATLKAEVQNSVILGTEGTPQAMPDGKASQAEAEAGASNEKWMTPLRTSQAIEAAQIVHEYQTAADFPASGRLHRLYLAADTGTIHRWTGSTYTFAPGSIDAGTF